MPSIKFLYSPLLLTISESSSIISLLAVDRLEFELVKSICMIENTHQIIYQKLFWQINKIKVGGLTLLPWNSFYF